MAVETIIGLAEVSILALTLLISVGLSVYVARQTQNHFALEHSQKFIERFNSDELAAHQRRVDEWIDAGNDVSLLADNRFLSSGKLELRDSILTVCNIFQELGTAYKHRVVKRDYVWDVFGAFIRNYWRQLSPFILELRKLRNRQTLFQDFEDLAAKMAKIDKRYRLDNEASSAGKEPAGKIYLFGYGSLINPSSLEKTLGRKLNPALVRNAWLNGYRRTWNVYDFVVADGGDGLTMPMAFYNVEPDAASRCNGVLIPVKNEDLKSFDIRERQYIRVDVTEAVQPVVPGIVYTYVGKAEARELPKDAVVAESYERLVADGIQSRGDRFKQDFCSSTPGHDLRRFSGDYQFKVKAQNKATDQR
jgi:hypothetical protein